jgi:hypothetical protein
VTGSKSTKKPVAPGLHALRAPNLASATKKFEKIAGACKTSNFFDFASLAVGFLLARDGHLVGGHALWRARRSNAANFSRCSLKGHQL